MEPKYHSTNRVVDNQFRIHELLPNGNYRLVATVPYAEPGRFKGEGELDINEALSFTTIFINHLNSL